MLRTPAVIACLLLLAIAVGASAPRALAAKAHPTVRESLDGLLATGQIDATAHDRYEQSYDDAQLTLGQLTGERFRELKAVLSTLDQLAPAGVLIPSRLPLLFETLDVNRRWWATGPLLAYGQRPEVTGSPLVWQMYPGQGLQIQWLGTFGRANALFNGGRHYDERLGALLDHARSLASARAGGIAWEYAFSFDGGRPPWVSGLAQATALQAFSRAAIRLQRPELFQVARDALGIFHTAPPEGVRVNTATGAHYLIYSFAPKLRVLNAFAQAVSGLRDFAALAYDADANALFLQGEAQLRAELPAYDTGAWSLYSQARESDLGYHKLLRDFLAGLCQRLTKDGTPDPAVYCQTAEHFTSYLSTAPRLTLQDSGTPRVKRPAVVRFTLSKIAIVNVTIRRGGAVVFSASRRMGRGAHSVGWGRPRAGGPVSVSLRAVDLAGNLGTASGALDVRG